MRLLSLLFLLLLGLCLDCRPTAQAATPPRVLVPEGARTEWRYLDDGSQPPATWTSAAFDDHQWKAGRAPLGYGEPNIATEISFGGNPNAKHLAAYFRCSFEFAHDRPRCGKSSSRCASTTASRST